ncbi:MAG TPA: class I SAM-dependent methyltransferase [Conexibacter sp.]|nr:class I SAM-dependent methyltransferase [Conexibacter sp.]
MAGSSNVCAGPFGAFYDFYIERPRLAQAIGHMVWGVGLAALYASMEAVGRMQDGATILDVPCGGGVALRALRPEQRVRYVAIDIEQKMIDRFQRRARERSLHQVEPLLGDMRALPLPDACADLCLSYSGLHMISDPAAAIAEVVRCLKPGGELIGTTFLAAGTRRQRFLLGRGHDSGVNGPCPPTQDLLRWLQDAGIDAPTVSPDRGFAVFRGRKRAG